MPALEQHPSINVARNVYSGHQTAPAGGHLAVHCMPAFSRLWGPHSASSSVFSWTISLCSHLMWWRHLWAQDHTNDSNNSWTIWIHLASEVFVKQCCHDRWFQMDWDVQCEKCGIKYANKNHRKKHIRYTCGDKVRFVCSYPTSKSSRPAKHNKPSFCWAQ